MIRTTSVEQDAAGKAAFAAVVPVLGT